MKKKINLPPFLNPAGKSADELVDEYSAGSSPPSTKPSRRPVAPATPAAAQGNVPAPGGAYQTIDIGPIDIDPGTDIGPPDLGDIPISLGGDEPPDFHHGEEREDDRELGDPREELDPEDFGDPSESEPSGGGGGGGGGGGVRMGGGGGGG
jgi:hypothetical protein